MSNGNRMCPICCCDLEFESELVYNKSLVIPKTYIKWEYPIWKVLVRNMSCTLSYQDYYEQLSKQIEIPVDKLDKDTAYNSLYLVANKNYSNVSLNTNTFSYSN